MPKFRYVKIILHYDKIKLWNSPKNTQFLRLKSKEGKELFLLQRQANLSQRNRRYRYIYKTLKILVNRKTKITQRREWIDFDSKYFYPIFGLLMGSGTIFLLNSLINADIRIVRGASSSFMVFVIGLGVYFVLTKPISKSHGLRFRTIDLFIGIIFVLLGLGLLFFFREYST